MSEGKEAWKGEGEPPAHLSGALQEELTPEQMRKRSAWELEKQTRKAQRHNRQAMKRRGVPELCAVCQRPAQFYTWNKVPTPKGAVVGCKLPQGQRWQGSEVEELLQISSPMVKFGEDGHAHDACARRKE